MSNTIVLIENQILQFNIISDFIVKHSNYLKLDYSIYPSSTPQEYKNFIDYVRIFLNPRYNGEKRNKAFTYISSKLIALDPLLLIIDHILVGHHEAEDGLFLAKHLRDVNITTPILFLSRTEQNNIKVLKEYPNISGSKVWVSKSNSSDKFTLNEEHLNSTLFQSIDIVLSQKGNYTKLIFNQIDYIKDTEVDIFEFDEYKTDLLTKLETIRKSITLIANQDIKDLIHNFYHCQNRTVPIRKEFYESLKKALI